MDRQIVACPSCKAKFDVSAFRPGSRIRCGSCMKILKIPDRVGTGKVAPAPKAAPAKKPPPAAKAAPPPRAPSPKASPPKSAPAKDEPTEATEQIRAAAPAEQTAGKTEEPDAEPSPATSAPVVLDASPDELIGHRINDEFELVRMIGQGGYGTVYEGLDVTLKRRVAVKLMLREKTRNKDFVAKFLREARTAAQLSHPNIVKIHLVGFDKKLNQHFLAMEFVEGKSLSEIMAEEGAFSVERAVDVVVQSANGLGEAHRKNIIHRDIKPGNIMITDKGVVKITDFGLAKVYDPTDKASTIIGTPYFMPKEQFEGKVKDGRSDIYSLGVTCYYILTLKRPFEGATPAQVLLNILKLDPVPPSEHNPDVPEGVWRVMKKMLEREVEDRYATCDELLRDLRGWQAGENAEARVFCPSCGFGNLFTAEKCAECRTSLLEPCLSCGTPDFVTAKFCGNCGANLAREKEVSALMAEAAAHSTAGRIERALEIYRSARESSPENSRVIEGTRLAEQAIAERDESMANLEKLLVDEEFTQALELAEELADRYPGHAPVGELVDRARGGARDSRLSSAVEETRILVRGGDLFAACASAREALDIDPQSEEALELLAQAERGIERHGEAREEAARLEQQHQLPQALEAWKRALEIMPSDEAAQQALPRIDGVLEQVGRLTERALAALGKNDLAGARSALEDAAEVLPADPGTLEALDSLRKEEKVLATGLAEGMELLAEAHYPEGRKALSDLAEKFPGDARIQAARDHAGALIQAVEQLLADGRELLDGRRPELASLFARVAQRVAPQDGRAEGLLAESADAAKAEEATLASIRKMIEKQAFADAVEKLGALGGVAARNEEVASLARTAYEGVREGRSAAREETQEIVDATLRTARELLAAGRGPAARAACQRALRMDRRSKDALGLIKEIEESLDPADRGKTDSTIKTSFFDMRQAGTED